MAKQFVKWLKLISIFAKKNPAWIDTVNQLLSKCKKFSWGLRDRASSSWIYYSLQSSSCRIGIRTTQMYKEIKFIHFFLQSLRKNPNFKYLLAGERHELFKFEWVYWAKLSQNNSLVQRRYCSTKCCCGKKRKKYTEVVLDYSFTWKICTFLRIISALMLQVFNVEWKITNNLFVIWCWLTLNTCIHNLY